MRTIAWDGQPLGARRLALDVAPEGEDPNGRLVLAAACDGRDAYLLAPAQIGPFLEAHVETVFACHDLGRLSWAIETHLGASGDRPALGALWAIARGRRLLDVQLLDRLGQDAADDAMPPPPRPPEALAMAYGINAPDPDPDGLAGSVARSARLIWQLHQVQCRVATRFAIRMGIPDDLIRRFGPLTVGLPGQAVIALTRMDRLGVHVREAIVVELIDLCDRTYADCSANLYRFEETRAGFAWEGESTEHPRRPMSERRKASGRRGAAEGRPPAEDRPTPLGARLHAPRRGRESAAPEVHSAGSGSRRYGKAAPRKPADRWDGRRDAGTTPLVQREYKGLPRQRNERLRGRLEERLRSSPATADVGPEPPRSGGEVSVLPDFWPEALLVRPVLASWARLWTAAELRAALRGVRASAGATLRPRYEIVPRLMSRRPNLERVRALVAGARASGDAEALDAGVFVPAPGHVFLVGRFDDLALRCHAESVQRLGGESNIGGLLRGEVDPVRFTARELYARATADERLITEADLRDWLEVWARGELACAEVLAGEPPAAGRASATVRDRRAIAAMRTWLDRRRRGVPVELDLLWQVACTSPVMDELRAEARGDFVALGPGESGRWTTIAAVMLECAAGGLGAEAAHQGLYTDHDITLAPDEAGRLFHRVVAIRRELGPRAEGLPGIQSDEGLRGIQTRLHDAFERAGLRSDLGDRVHFVQDPVGYTARELQAQERALRRLATETEPLGRLEGWVRELLDAAERPEDLPLPAGLRRELAPAPAMLDALRDWLENGDGDDPAGLDRLRLVAWNSPLRHEIRDEARREFDDLAEAGSVEADRWVTRARVVLDAALRGLGAAQARARLESDHGDRIDPREAEQLFAELVEIHPELGLWVHHDRTVELVCRQLDCKPDELYALLPPEGTVPQRVAALRNLISGQRTAPGAFAGLRAICRDERWRARLVGERGSPELARELLGEVTRVVDGRLSQRVVPFGARAAVYIDLAEDALRAVLFALTAAGDRVVAWAGEEFVVEARRDDESAIEARIARVGSVAEEAAREVVEHFSPPCRVRSAAAW